MNSNNPERELVAINTYGISDSDLDEIICRFLINLPEEEKQCPRIFQNIREACWFYCDNYFPIPPKA
jgi:hypothetical protein